MKVSVLLLLLLHLFIYLKIIIFLFSIQYRLITLYNSFHNNMYFTILDLAS